MTKLRRLHPLTIGYAIAALLFSVLGAWAKSAGYGMAALLIVFALVLGWCCAWRVITGRWPGDEFYSSSGVR